MTQVDRLKFYFVLRNANATAKDASNEMHLAFEGVSQYGGNTKWVDPKFCMKHTPSPMDVFIVEKFEGKEFEKLKENSAKIIGAKCLLACINAGRSIPPGTYPIFSEAMRGLIVSTTGFDHKTKKALEENIKYMSGMVDKALSTFTTHVVAFHTLSAKAVEGYRNKKKVMCARWVETLWRECQSREVRANDPEFQKLISPLFNNLRITTSGIPKKEKEKLRDLVTQHGGTFTGELEEKRTHLVILSKPEGDKFKFAKAWNIPCVAPSWLTGCIEAEAVLPPADFALTSHPKSSTPKKDDLSNLTANFSMVSHIGHVLTHLDETSMSVTSTFQAPKSVPARESRPDYAGVVDELIKNVRDAGQFLDGCNVFLTGFTAEHGEKLRRVVNLSGATRFDELSKAVSHIIVGGTGNMDVEGFRAAGAVVVSVGWLGESMRLGRPAPEGGFLLLDAAPLAPSPLSKQGAQMLSRADRTVSQPQFEEEDQGGELLCRYGSSQQGEPIEKHQPLSRSTTLKTETTSDTCFAGLKFHLSGELVEDEAAELEEVIVERGGQVVAKRFSGVPDYAIVPILGASLADVTTKEIVNAFFIKDCCEEGAIVPVQYYHQPVALAANTAPLKGCAITVSNYIGCEREFIELVIQSLGAVAQSLLARKAKENNVLQSTHLVCSTPTGQKYNGALRWGLPVVHHDWLLKCASLGIRVSEQPFLVGDSKLSTSAASTTSDLSCTPAQKIAKQFQTPDFGAVHKNKTIARLKQSETPKNNDSVDMNRTVTPTSPYGAFYGNDNPSPATRKRLLKWMNQGAEFPQDPPMEYSEQKRNSTPLSELLSRQLLLMKRKPEDLPQDSPVSAKRANIEEPSPSQADLLAGLEKMREIEENLKTSREKDNSPGRKSTDSGGSSTRRCKTDLVVVEESQPHTEVGWEYPLDREITLNLLEKQVERPAKVFMLSGFGDDVEEAKKLIEDSGGKVSELPHFDRSATHLIAANMTRGEKLMGSIAAGIWVLHPSYMDELRKVKNVHDTSDEDHEWGNPNKSHRTASLSTNAIECATSSYLWRKDIQAGAAPPFRNMKIILNISISKRDSFQRLLEAGEGVIVEASPPFSDSLNATLCISELSNKDKIDFESLAKRGCNCVSQLFISDHILKKPEAIKRNLLPGYLKYWTG